MKQFLGLGAGVVFLGLVSGAAASELYRPLAVCRGVESAVELRVFQRADRPTAAFILLSVDGGQTLLKADASVQFDAEGYPHAVSPELGLEFQVSDEDPSYTTFLLDGQKRAVTCVRADEA